MLAIGKFGEYNTDVKYRIKIRELIGVINMVEGEERAEIYGRSTEGIGLKNCLHGPMKFAKKLKLLNSYKGPGPATKKTKVLH